MGTSMITLDEKRAFLARFDQVQAEVHRIACGHGWWTTEKEDGTCIALMHSELSEALEACRLGNPPSEICDGVSEVEIELADVIIRIMDFACRRGLHVSDAILAKMEYNRERPYKHGDKKF